MHTVVSEGPPLWLPVPQLIRHQRTNRLPSSLRLLMLSQGAARTPVAQSRLRPLRQRAPPAVRTRRVAPVAQAAAANVSTISCPPDVGHLSDDERKALAEKFGYRCRRAPLPSAAAATSCNPLLALM